MPYGIFKEQDVLVKINGNTGYFRKKINGRHTPHFTHPSSCENNNHLIIHFITSFILCLHIFHDEANTSKNILKVAKIYNYIDFIQCLFQVVCLTNFMLPAVN